MSTQEHIFLDARESPEQVAEQLAPVLGAAVVRGERGEVYLGRPAAAGTGEVGGEIYRNDLGDPDAPADEQSVIDLYPTVFDVAFTGRNREIQFEEATRLFQELAAGTPFRMVFVRGFDFLIAAASPATGVVWLPDKTTPYAEDRALWNSFRP